MSHRIGPDSGLEDKGCAFGERKGLSFAGVAKRGGLAEEGSDPGGDESTAFPF